MFCTECGHEIRDDVKFCPDCGHPNVRAQAGGAATGNDPTPAPTATAKAGPDDRPVAAARSVVPGVAASLQLPGISVPAWLRQAATEGWGGAVIGAAIAVVGLFLIGLVAAVPLRMLAGADWRGGSQGISISGLAGIIGFGLARFPLEFEGVLDLVFVSFRGSAQAALTNVTVLVLFVWLLMAGGRYASRSVETSDPRVAALQGVKMGIPVALFSLVASYFFEIGNAGSRMAIESGGAFWWGLLSGSLFGLAGAVRASRKRGLSPLASALPVKLRAWGDVAGGAVTAFLYGVVLSALIAIGTIVVLVLTNIGDAGFGSVGDFLGLAVVVVFVVPNLVLQGLLFAHGGSYELTWVVNNSVEGPFGISYLNFPLDDPTLGEAGVAPWYLFLLLLVPLIATMAGAYKTAVRSDSTDRDAARRNGMWTAVPYGLILALVAAFTGFAVSGALEFQTRDDFDPDFITEIAGGFSPLGVLVAGVVWGVVGAVLASLRFPTSAPRPASSASDHPPASPPPTPEPGAETVVCSNCGTGNPAGNAFCNSCGEPIAEHAQTRTPEPADAAADRVGVEAADDPAAPPDEQEPQEADTRFCTSCGTANPADNSFCHSCGEPLA